MPTTAYLAGTDSNDLELAYAPEATWGVSPTGVNYQKVRVNNESLAEQKNRSDPPEIRDDWQSAAETTQDVQANGGLQFGISYRNMDDLYAGALTGAWTDDLAISDDGISFAASGNTIAADTVGTFTDVVVGQHIKVAGTSDNDGFYRVLTKADSQTLTVDADLTDESAGATVAITGSMLRNAKIFTSYTMQKRLASGLGFAYPGTFWTGGQINASRGQFFSGQLNGLSKSEEKAVAALGTGFTAAPANRVMNSVGNFNGFVVNEAPSVAKVMSLNTSFVRTGANMAFAMGSEAAQGVGSVGKLKATGTMQIFFEDYDYYDKYKSEEGLLQSYRVTDVDGNTYVVTVPELVLGSSRVVVGGPNQPVMAEFNWSANPSEAFGCTIQLDRMSGS
ncbi:hypothetical protein FHS78_000614 [Parvibaculum indicum]|uniref:phage tail tube protein n=1 Tax=Parvibaculum indicum TaxID=562969 RepID=UPI0014239845|nr:phage tail tube protein [Parvibaculum indicum]NIJ40344.1 hypothetical protein [Parvibaculum indicum]